MAIWKVDFIHGTTGDMQSLEICGTEDFVYSEADKLCPPNYFISIQPIIGRMGGKRPGAGRKTNESKGIPKATQRTKVVRVPVELADDVAKITKILSVIRDWELLESEAAATSPRWERCRQLLADLREVSK